jgi:hypothetical protein
MEEAQTPPRPTVRSHRYVANTQTRYCIRYSFQHTDIRINLSTSQRSGAEADPQSLHREVPQGMRPSQAHPLPSSPVGISRQPSAEQLARSVFPRRVLGFLSMRFESNRTRWVDRGRGICIIPVWGRLSCEGSFRVSGALNEGSGWTG